MRRVHTRALKGPMPSADILCGRPLLDLRNPLLTLTFDL